MTGTTGRRSFIGALLALTLTEARARATAPARVALGLPAGEARETLRTALEGELGRNAAFEVVEPSRATFMLNASLRQERAGCVVSVVVEERRSGRLRAILEGSARTPSPDADVETSALVRVAVRSALRSLGRAIA